jgi:hypothetical protein
MLNKIFLLLLAIAIIAMSVLTFFTFQQLQSTGFSPSKIIENFSFYESLQSQFLWISSLILLIFANVLLWTNKSIWSLWLSFLYFAVFILLNTMWLGELAFAYKKTNGLSDGSFSLLGIAGAVLCVIVAVGVFFDQFIVLRLRAKTSNKPQEIATADSQVIESESDKVS